MWKTEPEFFVSNSPIIMETKKVLDDIVSKSIERIRSNGSFASLIKSNDYLEQSLFLFSRALNDFYGAGDKSDRIIEQFRSHLMKAGEMVRDYLGVVVYESIENK